MTKQDEIVLKVEDLRVSFAHDGEYKDAVKGANFEVLRNRTLGIVGESGSGKSVSSLAIMGLLPQSARAEGVISFGGDGASKVDFATWRTRLDENHFRGSRVSMIFQEPMTSLNPVQRC